MSQKSSEKRKLNPGTNANCLNRVMNLLFHGEDFGRLISQGVYSSSKTCITRRTFVFTKEKKSLSVLENREGIMIQGAVLRENLVWGICCTDKTTSVKEPEEKYVLCFHLGKKWISHAIVSYLGNDRSVLVINTNLDDVNQELSEMEEKNPSEINKQIQEMVMKHNKNQAVSREEEDNDGYEKPAHKRHEQQPSADEKEILHLMRDGKFVPYAYLFPDGTIQIIQTGETYTQSQSGVPEPPAAQEVEVPEPTAAQEAEEAEEENVYEPFEEPPFYFPINSDEPKPTDDLGIINEASFAWDAWNETNEASFSNSTL